MTQHFFLELQTQRLGLSRFTNSRTRNLSHGSRQENFNAQRLQSKSRGEEFICGGWQFISIGYGEESNADNFSGGVASDGLFGGGD